MKRAFVPAALHAELTEHASLVRTLRTARTLDLTAQLLLHAAQHSEHNDQDTWTAWPLIDCPVPEWSLDDEIRNLAESIARDHNDPDPGSDSDDDDDQLSPATSRQLVVHTTAVLVHVLNLLADQRPTAPGSMQNRLWPMNWQDVISLLAVGGRLHPSIVARAEKRLEHIYGPSSAQALDRLKSATSAKTIFSSLTAAQEDHLLAPPVLSRTRRSDGNGKSVPVSDQTKNAHVTVTRKHLPGSRVLQRGPKSRAIIDTDTDTDA